MSSITSLNQYQLLGNSGLRVSPLALGAMTFGDDWGWGADVARYQLAQASGMLTERNLEIVETVKSVAEEIGASPSQVALRWVLDQPGVVAPIVGARKLSHLEENLGCLDIELDAGQRQRLDAHLP